MRLQDVELSNFRNYESAHLAFHPGINAIIGANGKGKTNLLEAICLVISGRSPRTPNINNMVRWGQEDAAVRATLTLGGRDTQLRVTLRGRARTLNPWGLPIERKCLSGAVMFFPDHLRIVKDEPEKRRHFLDDLLDATSPSYSLTRRRYLRVLRHRNILLRDPRPGASSALASWDEALLDYGSQIMRARLKVVGRLKPLVSSFYESVKGESLELGYESKALESEDPGGEIPTKEHLAKGLRGQLAITRDQERKKGITLVGPHRDELKLVADGVELRAFGSQGEQRTAALALKFAELKVFGETLGEPPLLLLDDVLSELDEDRRRRFLGILDDQQQVLLTTTHATDLSGCEKSFEVVDLRN